MNDVVFYSSFYYVLLVSVQQGDKVLTIGDLPSIPITSLFNITIMIGPQGVPYQLSSIKLGTLLRFKLGMSVFIDRWVSHNDMNAFISAINAEVLSWGPCTLFVIYKYMQRITLSSELYLLLCVKWHALLSLVHLI